MSSNKIIFVVLVILVVVSFIGTYAGYQTSSQMNPGEEWTGVEPEETDVSVWDVVLPWGDSNIVGTFIKENIFSHIPIVGESTDELEFLDDLLTFQIPGMPVALVLFFWVLLFMATLAIARIIFGALAGGGG